MRRLTLGAVLLLATAVATPHAAEDAPDNAAPAEPASAAAATPPAAGDAPAADGDAPGDPPVPPTGASPRAQYNAALALLEADAFQGAADGFLAARDAAGTDATLRYRAAFNLGLALAGQADAAEDAETLETLRASAAWFHDAARLAPEGDEDARVNLELVLRRIERLADQLNRGNALAARLNRIIDDQRSLRDGIRGLLAAIDAQGAAAEPTGFKADFEALAARERALLAEAAAVADLGAAERGHLDDIDAPTPEQAVRGAQLEGMERFLQRSRQSLDDARRRLRRLEGTRAHRRADAALAELKRAREQLQDPLTTLRAIVADELAVLRQTAALAALAAPRVVVGEDPGAEAPPAWLTPEHLVNRQEDVAARTGATTRRIEAAATPTDAAQDTGQGEPQGGPDAAAAQRVREAAALALPHLNEGLAAMRDAITALGNAAFDRAAQAEGRAVRSLNQAIERFADLRGLIELAYADQSQATALLTPPEDAAGASAPPPLTEAERRRAVTELAEANRERLRRIEPLLRETLPAPSAAADPDSADEDDAAARAAAEQRLEAAEAHRAAAAKELDALLDALGAAPAAGAALPPAAAALGHIEALRRLFLNFVEHLLALIGEQSDTHDRAATLQFESQLDRLVPELDLVAARQAGHAALGDSLAQALAERADAAAAEAPADAAEPAALAPETLAEAAAELRAGAAHLHGANAIIAAAAEAAAASSPDLEPALDEQLAGIERLENALRLLQPPPEDGDEGGDAPQQAANAQPAEAQPDDAAGMSQRQAMRRLQAIRDRDAQRRRDRRQQPSQPAPVEKDW